MKTPQSIAWIGAGLGGALLVAAAAVGTWQGWPGDPQPIALQFLDIGALLWAGAFVTARRPANAVGVVLLLGGLAASLLQLLTYYANAALVGGAPLPGGAWVLAGEQVVWPAVYFLLFALLPLLFPDGHFLSPRWRLLARSMAVLTLIAIAVAPLDPELEAGGRHVPNPITAVDPAQFGLIVSAWTVLFYGGVLAALGSLILRYRRSDSERRNQIRWVAAAVGLTLVVVVAQQASTLFTPALAVPDFAFLVPLTTVPAAIAFAVVRHRLFDIDLAIRRSIVFGALWVAIALAYAGLAAVLGLAAGQLSVQAAVLATIAATVLFAPARTRLERLADRLAYGSRAGAYELLRDFGAATEQTLEIHEIGPRLADAARRGMAAQWARILVGDGAAGGLVLGVSGDVSAPAALTVPLVRGDEVVGTIECGPRSEGEYRPGDLEVLSTLGRQAALAIQNAALAADLDRRIAAMDEQARELAASRSRIIDAQEAERRRIERDLHDGVQQQLVSLVAGVRLARNRLPGDPERAASVLQELQDQGLGAIRELRELVRGIHPPVLEDAGLVRAIEAVTARLPLTVTMEVEGDRSARYPARVESAAYFVVCEALTNVMKHAGVGEASVRIARSNGSLAITICDEGAGFDAPPAHGSGIAGLHDRAAAVGGDLRVVSGRGRGTTVAVTLPVDVNG